MVEYIHEAYRGYGVAIAAGLGIEALVFSALVYNFVRGRIRTRKLERELDDALHGLLETANETTGILRDTTEVVRNTTGVVGYVAKRIEESAGMTQAIVRQMQGTVEDLKTTNRMLYTLDGKVRELERLLGRTEPISDIFRQYGQPSNIISYSVRS